MREREKRVCVRVCVRESERGPDRSCHLPSGSVGDVWYHGHFTGSVGDVWYHGHF